MNNINRELLDALKMVADELERAEQHDDERNGRMMEPESLALQTARAVIEKAERMENHRVRVAFHYHNGLCNAVYVSDPEAVKVVVIDTDDDDDPERKERDARRLEVVERLPEYSDYWRAKLPGRRVA